MISCKLTVTCCCATWNSIAITDEEELVATSIEKTKQELSKQHEIIHDISNNIKNTMTSIENTTVLNDELYILENKIKKHKEIISITEKDLEIINIQ